MTYVPSDASVSVRLVGTVWEHLNQKWVYTSLTEGDRLLWFCFSGYTGSCYPYEHYSWILDGLARKVDECK